MLRLLTFTNLYPSIRNPRHGIFVEQRLRRLVESGRVRAQALVPMPVSPLRPWAVPPRTERFGIPVVYVPFPAVRGLTAPLNPWLMALAARRAVGAPGTIAEFDVIDAHFLYPDGVAAAIRARWLDKPFVLTARGSDVNVAARERLAGRGIRWAARQAAGLVAVSKALAVAMEHAGIGAGRVRVLRNGVDLETFQPRPAHALRARLGGGALLLSVGNLVDEKGHGLTLQALAQLPDARLVLIGHGPSRERLEREAQALGVAGRVTWLEPIPQEELALYYSAADLTVLASTREGMPNVLLESLACGTPVVSTAVGGAPEVVTDPVAGALVASRDPRVLADACRALLAAPPDRAAVRAYARRFGWDEPIAGLLELLESATARAAATHA